jgi:hypothetical protein
VPVLEVSFLPSGPMATYSLHLADNNSQYQTNIVLQLSDNETVKNATNALTKKHPDNSYIAKIDDNSKLTVYDYDLALFVLF